MAQYTATEYLCECVFDWLCVCARFALFLRGLNAVIVAAESLYNQYQFNLIK